MSKPDPREWEELAETVIAAWEGRSVGGPTVYRICARFEGCETLEGLRAWIGRNLVKADEQA